MNKAETINRLLLHDGKYYYLHVFQRKQGKNAGIYRARIHKGSYKSDPILIDAYSWKSAKTAEQNAIRQLNNSSFGGKA